MLRVLWHSPWLRGCVSYGLLCCIAPGHHVAANCNLAHSSARYCWWLGAPLCHCCWALSDNELGPDGAQALAPSLATLVQLQTLDLSGEWSILFRTCATDRRRMYAPTSLTVLCIPGNALDVRGSHRAGVVSAAICLSLPQSATTVWGLHNIDAPSAAVVMQLWTQRHSTAPKWLQDLTIAASPRSVELPSILLAALTIPAYAHIAHQVLQLAPEMQQLLSLQTADSSTPLHLTLAAAVAPRHITCYALSRQLQTLLYVGVPLGATNSKGQTATKQARLAIQRLRAEQPAQAQRDTQYVSRVEAVLTVLERLQGAGNGLRFFIKEGRNKQERRTVVRRRCLAPCLVN